MGVRVREKVKGSGIWWVFVNHKGKRASQKVGDKRTANQLKKRIDSEIANGLWFTGESSSLPTLAVQGQAFLDSPLREWSERTRKESQIIFDNHVKPALGNKPIDEIGIKDIKELLRTVKGRGLSSATAKAVLRMVSVILEDAREDGQIDNNPCIRMGKHCGNGTVKEPNPLEPHEVVQLLENAKTLEVEVRILILVAVRTGLRIGEMLALEWTDIDLDGRTVEITKSFDYHNQKVKSTKTGTTRTVRLTPQTVEGLRELREKRNCGNIVFCDENGDHLPHKKVGNWLKAVSPQEKYITLHDLRHTYATLRIAKGDNIVDVSKQLGHSKIETTLRSYTHWVPSDQYVHQVDELDNLHFSAPYLHPEISKKPGLH
jgi:integrase